jgi:hypothetical protein
MTIASIAIALDRLTNFAWKKPRTLAIILLMACLFTCIKVIVYQQKRIVDLEVSKLIIQDRCDRRIDSITLTYSLKEDRLNTETKTTLNVMIEDYKQQLKEQRDLNRRVDNSINEASRTLHNNEQKLKKLKDVN